MLILFVEIARKLRQPFAVIKPNGSGKVAKEIGSREFYSDFEQRVKTIRLWNERIIRKQIKKRYFEVT